MINVKFLDSNILVYAFFETGRKLKEKEKDIKKKSREIVKKIDGGEKVSTSVIHLSEVSNILATCLSPKDLSELLISLSTKENVRILGVSSADFLMACQMNARVGIKINDCLAAYLMKVNGIKEIYTFDKDFKKIDWVKIRN